MAGFEPTIPEYDSGVYPIEVTLVLATANFCYENQYVK